MKFSETVFTLLVSGLAVSATADDSLPDHATSATQMSAAGIAFVEMLSAESPCFR